MSELTLRFSAKKIHLVVSFPESNIERQGFITTRITDKDGTIISQQKIELTGDNLYTIADLGEFLSDGTLTIYTPNTRPVRLHAFTF
jgi:Thioredoxin like C-terminal domain